MNILRELRRRVRFIIGPVFGICAVCYFSFHAIHGDRGLFALYQYSYKVREAQDRNHILLAHRKVLENQVKLLNPEHLDPDMLEERAREMVDYGFSGDIVIVTK